MSSVVILVRTPSWSYTLTSTAALIAASTLARVPALALMLLLPAASAPPPPPVVPLPVLSPSPPASLEARRTTGNELYQMNRFYQS